MKKSLVRLFLVGLVGFGFSGCVSSQGISPMMTQEGIKQEVVNVELSKNDLFEKSKIWMAEEIWWDKKKIFEDIVENKETGIIVGKGTIYGVVYGGIPVYTKFTLEMRIKDNQSVLIFKDPINAGTDGSGEYRITAAASIKVFKPYLKKVITDYDNFTHNKAPLAPKVAVKTSKELRGTWLGVANYTHAGLFKNKKDKWRMVISVTDTRVVLRLPKFRCMSELTLSEQKEKSSYIASEKLISGKCEVDEDANTNLRLEDDKLYYTWKNGSDTLTATLEKR